MPSCQVVDCTRLVSNAGHQFCLEHWRAERNKKLTRCQRCQRWHDQACPLCRECAGMAVGSGPQGSEPTDDFDSPAGYLSSTRLGKGFGLSSVKINLILAELGWIEKYVKGWVPTDRGNAL